MWKIFAYRTAPSEDKEESSVRRTMSRIFCINKKKYSTQLPNSQEDKKSDIRSLDEEDKSPV